MAEFEVVRQIVIAAEPARIHGLINDFHEWIAWSPWEDLDPEIRRMYSGPDAGVGARYAWEGNRRAGRGTMEITSSTEQEIRITLDFEKPFKSTNNVVFTLTPEESGGTRVVWRMSGEQRGLMALMGKVISMDSLVGKDFEKGLGRLRVAAEAAPG
jgi:hypothetical protein